MKQEITRASRHINDFFDAGAKLIVTAQEVSLPREVYFDRLFHAGVKELCVLCGVKEAVVVCGVGRE